MIQSKQLDAERDELEHHGKRGGEGLSERDGAGQRQGASWRTLLSPASLKRNGGVGEGENSRVMVVVT